MSPSNQTPPTSLPELRVTCALIEVSGRLLAARRSQTMPDPGLWEFPGGKLESNESPESCLQREIFEELGITILVGAALPEVVETQAQRILRLMPFACQLQSGEPIAYEHAELRWLSPDELLDLAWIPADLTIVRHWLRPHSDRSAPSL